MLSRRLSDISTAARQSASPSIVSILGSIKAILDKKQSDFVVVSAALRALSSIATTLEAAEQGALAELVPILLTIIDTDGDHTEAWQALLPLSKQIGPRIIPYFRIVVQQSVRLLKQETTSSGAIYATLQALLSSIPTFWSMPEVLAVLMLYIDGVISSSMSALVKALTRRVSAKVLLPSILDIWSKLHASASEVSFLFCLHCVVLTISSASTRRILRGRRAYLAQF